MGVNRYILIAEDDTEDQDIIQNYFLEQGFDKKLVFANDGEELLENLYNTPAGSDYQPKLILLDLNMPKKTGKEALWEIKQHPVLKAIPVIVLSTATDYKEVKECYLLGANLFIGKPSTPRQMRSIVDLIIKIYNIAA